MAIIKPFRGYRPVPERAEEVAALPYDVLTSEAAAQMVQGRPYSFLHVDKAEIDFPEGIDPYDDRVYEKAGQNLQKMIAEGIYVQDEKPCCYIYRQTREGRTQTGLVACVSVDEYLQNRIKKHEFTRQDKEEDRVRHVDACNAHTGPIFLAYRHHEDIRRMLNIWMEKPPVYQFASSDEVKHEVWVIDDAAVIALLTMQFSEIPSFYIADGHHRAASAVRVAEKRRKQHPDYRGDEEFNYFLAVLFPDDELMIMEYNRVVKDLNGLVPEEFLQKVEQKFDLEKRGETAPEPEKHQFGMFLQGEWYLLTARDMLLQEAEPTERLDASILQKNLLGPILGIQDPRTDERIDFVGGIHGVTELERRTREDMTVAFRLHAVSIEDLMAVADAGKVMPPKSTWFEPKLRSGLFVHVIEP